MIPIRYLSFILAAVTVFSCSAKITPQEGSRTDPTPVPEPLPETEKVPLDVRAKATPADAYSTYKAYTVERIPGFTPKETPQLDEYGGILSKSYEATGWFRVEKIDGRWWMIDPLGHPFIAASVGEFMVGGSDRQKQALSSIYNTTQRWAASELNWLKSQGFTAIGRGSSSVVINVPRRLPYCVFSNPMASFSNHLKNDLKYNIPTATPIAFDEAYDEYLSKLSWLTNYAGDSYCIGIFADNELFWTDDLLKIYLERLPAGNVSRKTAQAWFDARKGTTGASASQATAEDKDAFKAYCMDDYLKRTLAAIRTYDPNHMFIGNRFYKWPSELSSQAMMAVAGNYMDIVSINHYTKWEPDPADFDRWESWSGRPILISEFYVKGEDSGLPNNAGLGWVVPTQEDRGVFYENFIIGLIKTGKCVAWQWFKYQDNDPEDATADASNTDSNKGLVRWDLTRYDEMIKHMAAANSQVYNLMEFYK